MGFTGFDTYYLTLSHPKTRVTFLGSLRAETVSLEGQGQIKKAKLRGGDDVVRFERLACRRPTSWVAAGATPWSCSPIASEVCSSTSRAGSSGWATCPPAR